MAGPNDDAQQLVAEINRLSKEISTLHTRLRCCTEQEQSAFVRRTAYQDAANNAVFLGKTYKASSEDLYNLRVYHDALAEFREQYNRFDVTVH